MIKVPGQANSGMFNPAHINEQIFRQGDLKLQNIGLWIAVIGTFVWGYADAVLHLIMPFK